MLERDRRTSAPLRDILGQALERQSSELGREGLYQPQPQAPIPHSFYENPQTSSPVPDTPTSQPFGLAPFQINPTPFQPISSLSQLPKAEGLTPTSPFQNPVLAPIHRFQTPNYPFSPAQIPLPYSSSASHYSTEPKL